MTFEKPFHDLLTEFEAAFTAITKALATAAEQCSFSPAMTAVEAFELKEQGDSHPSTTYIYERRDGDLCLWLRTHWYDPIAPIFDPTRYEQTETRVKARFCCSAFD